MTVVPVVLLIDGTCGAVYVLDRRSSLNDFDDGALAALGRHTGRGKQIDSLFLVQRANHDLKLWIGENTRQSKDSRGDAGGLPETRHQKAHRARLR